MTPTLRREIKRILPMLVAEGGRLAFHGVSADDLEWAETELAGRRHVYATAGERWPDGAWATVTIEESVMVGVGIVDFVAKHRTVAPGHPDLERVSAAFDRGGSNLPRWVRGSGEPPWR